MIDAEKAAHIEATLAELAGVQPEDVRDYLRGYIAAGEARRTGYRFVRGSHGGSYVADPEGTDVLPRGYTVAA